MPRIVNHKITILSPRTSFLLGKPIIPQQIHRLPAFFSALKMYKYYVVENVFPCSKKFNGWALSRIG
jgi:hypothetical protein